MNRVNLTGNISTDIDLKFLPGNGTQVAKFNLAVNEYDSKEKKNTAIFVPIVVWGKPAENLAQFCTKGSKVGVTGRISIRSYDAQDGTKRYVTEVVADNFGGIEYLNSKNGNGDNADNNTSSNNSNSDWNGTPVDAGNLPF